MAADAIQALKQEVQDIAAIPVGPQRCAAYSLCHRHLWDLLILQQRDLESIRPKSTRGKAMEILQSTQRALAILDELGVFMDAGAGKFASTDFAVLREEALEQQEWAERLSEESSLDPEVWMISVSSDCCDFTGTDVGFLSSSRLQIVDRGDEKVLYVRDDNVPDACTDCEYRFDGTCDLGCTVGGCLGGQAGLAW